MNFSKEQNRVFNFNKKNMIVSASAGAGKTTTMIEYITRLIEKKVPIKRMLVLTFTKAAASEMKDRLAERLLSSAGEAFIDDQIDDLMTSDISTIHSFLEKLIKRNISHLPELEGFVMLDEMQTEKIMNEAFEEAWQKLKCLYPTQYENLFFTIRDLKEIRNILFELHSFMSAQTQRSELLKMFEKNCKKYFFEACEYLKNQIVEEVAQITERIKGFLSRDDKISSIENFEDYQKLDIHEDEKISIAKLLDRNKNEKH